jgi:hypothetical protein
VGGDAVSEGYFITTYDYEGRLLVNNTVQDPLPEGVGGPYNLYVLGWWDQYKYYVVSGMVVERPDNPAQIDGMTLFNMPMPAQVRIDGVYYDATDSTMELDITGVGWHEVVVIAFPHKPAFFKVVVP